ncbi:hypothetical protein GGR51DRAFT_555583 [Nemania sp. FL0031]|nr:hypothetical protein GGR51DRAFT_555583 [Nemania sp. FL0031]
MSDSLIVDLSARIAANTAKVDEYLTGHDLSTPSFALGSPSEWLIPSTKQEIEDARQAVIYDCSVLRDLMSGPKESLISFKLSEVLCMQAILRYGLADSFPIDETTTYALLAYQSGLSEKHVRKILRLAMTHHIFYEPVPGLVAHTAASRLLVQDEALVDWLRFSVDALSAGGPDGRLPDRTPGRYPEKDL